MNLVDYLDPTIAVPYSKGLDSRYSFSSQLVFHKHGKPFPEINTGDIVIIGVPESRNSANLSASEAPELIRKYLFSLAPTSYKTHIIDVGNIKQTKSPTDTYAALRDLIGYFISKNSRVVVIGGTQELTIPIYEGLSNQITPINLSIIDSHIDISDNETEFESTSYLNKVVGKPVSNLFDLSLIGYQGYFCNSKLIEQLTHRNYETLRLGFVRGNIHEVEPTLRDSDFVSFDISAIRNSDCPGSFRPSPNGLYAEEACQLARLSGINEKNSVFGLFEYCRENDHGEISAHLAAQIIWHYIEASSQKKMDFASHSESDLKKFIVNIGPPESELVFYKSLISDLWWVEIKTENPQFPNGKIVISCSYNDYLLASKHEIPERWFRIFKKVT